MASGRRTGGGAMVKLAVAATVMMMMLVVRADAQPPRRFGPPGGGTGPARGGPPGGGGGEPATGCPAQLSSGACGRDGGSNYVDTAGLTYDAASGTFSGALVYNGCLHHATTAPHTITASCRQTRLPSAAGPSAAPLLGSVGVSRFGVPIYGPFENGFGSAPSSLGGGLGGMPVPSPCSLTPDGGIMSGTHGYCAGGIDVQTCEDGLKSTCGEENTITDLFMDACGGHANPYHYHTDLKCSYAATDAAHAPLLGFANDGHGLYGLNEADDLDACNGHFGEVPADEELGVPGGVVAYHYHTTPEPPFTIGCYGPVSSVEACRSLYDGCADGAEVALGSIVNDGLADGPDASPYKLWCPCYPQM